MRVRNAGLGEQPPAAGLGAERQVGRIGAVQRNAEAEREIALAPGRRVRDEVAPRGVGISSRIFASTRGRSSSFSTSERARPSCGRDHVQPRARLLRDHAREQREVVLDDALGDRAPGHVDHSHPRLAQQEQEKQHALLQVLQRGPGVRRVRHDRGHHDDRLPRLVEPHGVPERNQPLLESSEAEARSCSLSSLRRGAVPRAPVMPAPVPRRDRRRCRPAPAWRSRAGSARRASRRRRPHRRPRGPVG